MWVDVLSLLPPPQVRARNATKPALRFATSWDTRLSVAAGAAAGVAFMHHHGIVHRDLTSSNLVLDLAKGGGAAWVAKVGGAPYTVQCERVQWLCSGCAVSWLPTQLT